MDIKKIETLLQSEPRYRLQQAKKAIFGHLAADWQDVSNFSKDFQIKLNQEAPLAINGQIIGDVHRQTIKALITLKDNLTIEAVLMRHADGRNTVCVSSQVGCPLGCLFCATGQIGFKRNLTAAEIVEQVIFFARLLKTEDKKITNIVFMGMGEPLLNYEQVLSAIKILNDPDGFNLGARHFSISTVGIPEGIKKLSHEKLQINLALSLHATTDELRSRLIPVNQKYPIQQLFKAIDNYLQLTRRQVMIEYILIKDVNDDNSAARELIKLVKKTLYMVNLIVYNPTDNFQPSSPDRVKMFKKILEEARIKVTLRHKFGNNISAACGQLIAKNKKRNLVKKVSSKKVFS